MILAHRGFWKSVSEQNTMVSISRALDYGFGIETDIRDYNGELVISHNIPNKPILYFKEFLKYYSSNNFNNFLALNIKSDGQLEIIKNLIKEYKILNYSCFDMSIPETKKYHEDDIYFLIRISEVEKELSFYRKSKGVWLDCFFSDWYSKKDIMSVINDEKTLCIVSPELHKRNHKDFWPKIKSWDLPWKSNKIMICTDHPFEARDFFGYE